MSNAAFAYRIMDHSNRLNDLTFTLNMVVIKLFTVGLWLKIVALRENVVDRPESYDSFSAKGIYFLRTKKKNNTHGLGHISPSQFTNCPKVRYQDNPNIFIYYYCTITNLTNILHHPKQPWKFHTWIFLLSFAIFDISMFGHVTKGSQTL
jgi:hypothetical protein